MKQANKTIKVKEPEQLRTRREYAKKVERNQTMVSFRLDVENIDWLNSQPNKGRALNRLIENARKKGV